jgi:hypothetical protein
VCSHAMSQWDDMLHEDVQMRYGSEFVANRANQAERNKRLGETIFQASGEESSPGACESRRTVANRRSSG